MTKVRNLFERNAEELEKLRERVYEAVKNRDKGPKETAAWKEAASAFHAAYDRLAFPGGLTREFQLLKF